MQRTFLLIAGVSGALVVMLGAFGAHALKNSLSQEMLQAFETGVRYQFLHSFALIAIGLLPGTLFGKLARYSGICFVTGIIFFSGSLYLMATAGWTFMGPVTPLGGLFFIGGWILFVLNILKSKNNEPELR